MATSPGDAGGDRSEAADGAAETDSGENLPPHERRTRNRKRGVLSTLPFLGIGLFCLVLLLGWGLQPLWAFAILPPMLFCSFLSYLVFSTDFLEDRT